MKNNSDRQVVERVLKGKLEMNCRSYISLIIFCCRHVGEQDFPVPFKAHLGGLGIKLIEKLRRNLISYIWGIHMHMEIPKAGKNEVHMSF